MNQQQLYARSMEQIVQAVDNLAEGKVTTALEHMRLATAAMQELENMRLGKGAPPIAP